MFCHGRVLHLPLVWLFQISIRTKENGGISQNAAVIWNEYIYECGTYVKQIVFCGISKLFSRSNYNAISIFRVFEIIYDAGITR